MTLVVRDEENIIEDNIKYHLAQGVDCFFVADHNSKDNTRIILKKYQEKNLLHLTEEHEPGWQQQEFTTRLVRTAYNNYKPDWILINDADEFWCPQTGDLKTCLSKIPWWCPAVVVQRYNMRASRDAKRTDGHKAFYHRLIYKDRFSKNYQGKVLRSKVAYRGRRNLKVGKGNHKVAGSKIVKKMSRKISNIEILHFPIRSYEEFQRSLLNKVEGHLKAGRYSSGKGGKYQLYRDFKSDQSSLRRYYEATLLSPNEIGVKLRTGEIEKDERVKTILQHLAVVPDR